MLLLSADMLDERVTKGKLEPPYKRKGNHCYLCRFVRMDMMDLLPRLELASATYGYKAPDLGGELELVLYTPHLDNPATNLNARCPTHKKNCDLLNAGAYLSQILFFSHSWSSLEVVASSTFEASTQSSLSSSFLQFLDFVLHTYFNRIEISHCLCRYQKLRLKPRPLTKGK